MPVSPRSSPKIVGISSSPSTSSGGRTAHGFESPLIIIGIMVGIVALAVALWSMHKNSVLTGRLTEINSSLVDLIVEVRKGGGSPAVSKESTPVERLRVMRERLKEKREAAQLEGDILNNKIFQENLLNNQNRQIREMQEQQEAWKTQLARESATLKSKLALKSKERLVKPPTLNVPIVTKPTPNLPRREETVTIDMDDLEKDLMFLHSGQ